MDDRLDYRRGFFTSVFLGFIFMVVLAVALSIPGWIVAAFWGWTWFFRGAAMCWLGVMGVTLIVITLAAIGSDD